MHSLLNADVEERERERRAFGLMWAIVVPLVVPVAVGAVIPAIPVLWWALGLIMSVSMTGGQPSITVLVITLATSYLIFSAVVWVSMEWVRRQYFGQRWF